MTLIFEKLISISLRTHSTPSMRCLGDVLVYSLARINLLKYVCVSKYEENFYFRHESHHARDFYAISAKRLIIRIIMLCE
jgi:hypothetical protein